MKLSLFIVLLILSSHFYAQNKALDSLDNLVAKASSDTQRINRMIPKIGLLSSINLDSAGAFAEKTIAEAQRVSYKLGEAGARLFLASNCCFKGDYVAARKNLEMARGIYDQTGDSSMLAKMYDTYGMMHSMQNRFDSAHLFFEKGIEIASLRNDKSRLGSILQNDAISYQQQSNYQQALVRYQKALDVYKQAGDEQGEAYIYLNIAITQYAIYDTVRAEQNFLKAIEVAKKLGLQQVLAYAYSNLSTLYENTNRFQEQYNFAMNAVELAEQTGDWGIQSSSLSRAALALAYLKKFEQAVKLGREAIVVADSSNQPYNRYQSYAALGTILRLENKCTEAIPFFEKATSLLTDVDLYSEEVEKSYFNLSECYEATGSFKKALDAYKVSAKIADSVRGRENIRKATEQTMNYEFEKKEQAAKMAQAEKDAEVQKSKSRQNLIMTALAIGVVAVLAIAIILLRNNKQKQKTNLLLENQKRKVEETLTELRSTQSQLIQSEKMASLGELTAGIAHEIQNPLNFVNNFSEVSNELIDELNEELIKGDVNEAKLISNDIRQNLEKINHHGKRADAIVKGMLQHSRTSSGQKEATNINALANEYLRLAYHGIRAKDKSFNATLKTDFDESIENINIIPQDIGRVLVNLITNAFYAVDEKKKQLPEDYEPVVLVSTKKMVGKIEVRVADNGHGIPQNIIGKIFQPFFTTKPTGQGTGLGLSLAYDIIKAHGGQLRVETSEGEGTEFIIDIPTGD